MNTDHHHRSCAYDLCNTASYCQYILALNCTAFCTRQISCLSLSTANSQLLMYVQTCSIHDALTSSLFQSNPSQISTKMASFLNYFISLTSTLASLESPSSFGTIANILKFEKSVRFQLFDSNQSNKYDRATNAA